MKTIKIDKRIYLVGLSWYGVPRDANLNARYIDQLDPEQVTGRGLVREDSGERFDEAFIGVYRGDTAPPKRSVSLAQAVAKQYPDHVVLADLGGDDYWVVITHQGAVVPGTDVVGTQEIVHRTLQGYIGLFLENRLATNGERLLRTDLLDGDAAEWLGQMNEPAQALDLEGVAQSEDQPPPVEIIARGMSPVQKAGLSAIGIAVLGISSFFIYDGTQDDFEPAPPPEPPPEPAVDEGDREQREYMEQLVATLDGRLPVSNDWVRPTLDRVLMEHANSGMGWAFEGVNCTPSACDLSWVPYSVFRPVRGFHQEVGLPDGAVRMEDGGDALSASVDANEVSMQSMDALGVHELPPGHEVRSDWWDVIQMEQMRIPGVEFEQDRRGASRIGPAELPEAEVIRVEEGRIYANGANLAQLSRLMDTLNELPMRVTNVTYAPGTAGETETSQWRVEMTYVARQ
ncbi:hypothetical protein TK90_2831 (plasmid) [Thioalkalivibrio sp. K90mix]|uniref:type 4b pilus protein PilO2 n=1 Tax=Thioalkalivibrio sp. (strain K90mix) TaxID=396595 RepID=UPI000195A837|nr:type 4b pilus protein PilO2 [Thioalkalivibrio sp. K90mix]ADC73316.1 hypothetical protein TK90_2831 [Thioalkalivibrio sp. K90mix]